jgi:O-antigen ligase
MRRIAWVLLIVFVFAIPWEYSLDLGEPLGNVARIAGLLVLLVAVPAVLQAGAVRTPGVLQWLVLALYLWFCCSYFWTVDAVATLVKMRYFFQDIMIVWLVWEFAESPADLRDLLRASLAGSWVLAALTLANFASPEAIAAGQIRFAASGQDPNDAARFMDLGFPVAALLFASETRWPVRMFAVGYFPVALFAVLLTASREGFLAALAALVGCGILLARGRGKAVLGAVFALPAICAALWLLVPYEIFDRLATIPEQIQGGDLNRRWNIWAAGWQAFIHAPIFGSGAGAFVAAAGLYPNDTAHNTVLSILVAGGLCALTIALAIVVVAARQIMQMRGPLRIAMMTSFAVWALISLVSAVEESRTTWLLFGMIALGARLQAEEPERLAACFPESSPVPQVLLSMTPVA